MRLLPFILLLSVLINTMALAQRPAGLDDTWSLEQCVQYGVSHNISIKQDSLTAKLAHYTLLQSQLSQLPVVSANGGYGRSFGRSVDPTSNQFVDADYNFLSASANGNLLVFGWMQVRNTIAKNKYSLEASIADLDQLKDDVSLNIANSFLSTLLAKEQVNVSRNQVSLSQAQLEQTKAFTDAGRLPELNVAQLESQVASDSSNLITAIASYNSAVLDLKTLLNLDFSIPLSVKVPDIEAEEQHKVSVMDPENIYQVARTHFGSVKGSLLRVSSAEKSLAAAKGGLYPQFSINYQAGTNFASNYQSYQYTNQLLGYTPIGFVSPTRDTVYQPIYKTLTPMIPFGTQLSDNFRQTLMFNINIPLFNSWQSQYSVRQAKINLASMQLNEYNAELTLKQNVYRAHNNAIGSIQKYYAAKRAAEAARRALDFAKKRYDLGLTSTVDLLVTQNSDFVAASNLVGAKYDLIFKLKVIDYYLGKELKL
jgi:outer membrane protein